MGTSAGLSSEGENAKRKKKTTTVCQEMHLESLKQSPLGDSLQRARELRSMPSSSIQSLSEGNYDC